MPRKKKVAVGIMTRSDEIVRVQLSPGDVQATIARMVDERVREVIAERGASEIGHEFQSREVAIEIQRRQTMFDRHKWGLYFQKWGCRMCRKKKVSHMANGCCARCHLRVIHRLKQIRLEYERANPEKEIKRQIDHLTAKIRTAKAVLGERER